MIRLTKTVYPLILLCALGILWGSGYSLAKFATMRGVSPLGYAFWQSLGPALALLLLQLNSKNRGQFLKSLHSATHCKFFLITGLFGIMLPNTNMYFTAAHLPSGWLAIIVNTVAIWVYPLALLVKVETFDPARFIGVFLGLVGVMLLVFPSTTVALSQLSFYSLLALFSPFCFAICAVYTSKNSPRNMTILMSATGMLLVSCLFLIPIVLLTHNFYWFHWPLTTADLTILAEILLSTIGYLVFFLLIRIAGPVYYSLVNGVVAITGLFWGKFIFGEQPNLIEGMALILIISAILIVTRQHASFGEAHTN